MYGSVSSLSAGSSSPVSSASCSPTGQWGPCRGRELSGTSSAGTGSGSTSGLGVLGLAAHEARGSSAPMSSNPWSWNSAQGHHHHHHQQQVPSSFEQFNSNNNNSSSSSSYHSVPSSFHQQPQVSPPPSTGSSGTPPSPTVQGTNSNQIAQELFRLFMTPTSSTPATSSLSLGSLPVGALGHLPGHFGHLDSATSRPLNPSWDEFSSNGRESELDELDRLLRGLEVRDSRQAVMNLPDFLPGDKDQEILTKSRLLEILRERERQRSKRRGLLNKATKQGKVCVFCRNNGEAEAVYTSHQLKDTEGKITCPILYIYTCPICGANGPQAHTIKYCPLNPGDTPNIRSLKTARTSAGRRRNLP